MLKKSKLIIIEEPKFHTDKDDEITKLAKEKLSKSTVIFFTERIERVVECDRVLIVENGGLIEEGNPFELLVQDENDLHITKDS